MRFPCQVGGFCGKCYANARARASYPGHQYYRQPSLIRRIQVVFESKRSAPAPVVDACNGTPLADAMSARFPTLWQFLTLSAYADGARRLPGSVTVFFDQGHVKAALNDKDAGLSAFVSASSLLGLFMAIEEGLAGDKLDWRQPQAKGRRRT